MVRRVRDKEATRRRLLEAAAEVFAREGYHKASMDAVVQRAGVSKGALYFHFPGKEALFTALVDHLADSLIQAVEREVGRRRGAVAKVDAALQQVFSALVRHRRLARILLAGGGLGPALNRWMMRVHERFARLIRFYLDEAVAEGSIPPVDTVVASYAWLGAVNELVMRWLYTGEPGRLEEVLPSLRRLLLHSIGVEEGEDPARGGPAGKSSAGGQGWTGSSPTSSTRRRKASPLSASTGPMSSTPSAPAPSTR